MRREGKVVHSSIVVLLVRQCDSKWIIIADQRSHFIFSNGVIRSLNELRIHARLTGVLWNYEIDSCHRWWECSNTNSVEYLEHPWLVVCIENGLCPTFGQLFDSIVNRFGNTSLINTNDRWSKENLGNGEAFHIHADDLRTMHPSLVYPMGCIPAAAAVSVHSFLCCPSNYRLPQWVAHSLASLRCNRVEYNQEHWYFVPMVNWQMRVLHEMKALLNVLSLFLPRCFHVSFKI